MEKEKIYSDSEKITTEEKLFFIRNKYPNLLLYPIDNQYSNKIKKYYEIKDNDLCVKTVLKPNPLQESLFVHGVVDLSVPLWNYFAISLLNDNDEIVFSTMRNKSLSKIKYITQEFLDALVRLLNDPTVQFLEYTTGILPNWSNFETIIYPSYPDKDLKGKWFELFEEEN
jgi:hypothetical protein